MKLYDMWYLLIVRCLINKEGNIITHFVSKWFPKDKQKNELHDKMSSEYFYHEQTLLLIVLLDVFYL